MIKKVIGVATLSILGMNAVGLGSITAFANDEKQSDTKVFYTKEVEPAGWGLEVPATVELKKDSKYPEAYVAINKVKITNIEGGEFKDENLRNIFTIAYGPGGDTLINPEKDRLLLTNPEVPVGSVLNVGLVNEQGDESEHIKSSTPLPMYTPFYLETDTSGTKKPVQNIGFESDLKNVEDGRSLTKYNLDATMKWTAQRTAIEE
ncbi:hypothetical protein RZ529_09710 [Enterococcus faecalis]|uniref:hypothetical protein n=1 Tax=Enterococcus TaxID=1350 RepID=UPI001AD73114|nr:hypothetical protein [Enterococcus faecalis]MBO6371800.1 hypothetical protein [Enterococcus faecalis]MBO6379813.1 hypothetical protein [Enterococcus faecalis]MBO6383647.1 hypothetical protein [Enterococcus faecalis]MDV2914242.1 hypothetical protein [Enterococcus faecalis]MDV2932520.1 hypothetical protein [Enterococcus faecalis]